MRKQNPAKKRRGSAAATPKKRAGRRTSAELLRLAEKIALVCQKSAAGRAASSLARTLRSRPRALRPAIRLALSAGILRRVGAGRGALYFASSSPVPADAFGALSPLPAAALSKALGVDRKTIYRWRRGAAIPDFQRLRIAALGTGRVSGRGNPPSSLRVNETRRYENG